MNVLHGQLNTTDTDNRRLSVVIPCCDDGRYLSQAVGSVLSQKVFGVELEILIINDHSSDPHTLNVLSNLETTHREVQVLHNTGMPGPAAARNVGITAASGEWIAFLDSDDVWLPGGLLARWHLAQYTPDAQWIGADFVYWYEDKATDQEGFLKSMPLSGPLVCAAYRSGRPLRFVRPVREFLKCLLTWTGTVLVKKALLERVGGFDERLKGPEDFHLWVRLARAADFYFVPSVVARYRQHENSLMHGTGDLNFYRRYEALRLLSLDSAFEPYRDAIEGNLTSYHRDIAYYHLVRGERWRAAHHAAKAVLRKPSWIAAWKTLLYVASSGCCGSKSMV